MKIQADDLNSGFFIKSHETGKITVVNQAYNYPIILSRNHIIHPWKVNVDNMVNSEFLDAIKQQKPQVVILGTGDVQIFPKVEHLSKLVAMQISLEVMDTGSACRTFNIIQSEDREVLAGLII